MFVDSFLIVHDYPSCQHVFEYFTERTPRSYFEVRETSIVWNYKFAGKQLSFLALDIFVAHYFSSLINLL